MTTEELIKVQEEGFNQLTAVYQEGTRLYDLPDNEFLFGTAIDSILKPLGCFGSPRSIINQRNWWSLSISELFKEVKEEFIEISMEPCI